METRILPANKAGLDEAGQVLLAGGLVAFPTETVYGLGGLASRAESIHAIFAVKGRPTTDPLILHLLEPDLEKAVTEGWVAGPLPASAISLAEHFWPGPLTLILPRGPKTRLDMTAGLETVAVRCPAHPAAQKLLQKVGAPLAAPSANRFGRISPTDAEAVRQELGGRIPLIVDGGHCSVGLESTVVSLLNSTPEILRPGAVTAAQIERVLGSTPLLRTMSRPKDDAQIAPGQLDSHYSPQTPLYLCETPVRDFDPEFFHILFRKNSGAPPQTSLFLAEDGNLESAARELYRGLRQADQSGRKAIMVEPVPDGPWADALRDRLTRASVGLAHWNGTSWKLVSRKRN
ncbi:threonylcarbamoyl-AMP synthase [bacterium]|nr:threonylcarbamoyl-AMP synthase [bacterium]